MRQVERRGPFLTRIIAESSARPAYESYGRSPRFALAFITSTLGLGPQAALRFHGPFNLRVGVSGFNYRRNVADGGIVYDGLSGSGR